jgi:hypothetical protein
VSWEELSGDWGLVHRIWHINANSTINFRSAYAIDFMQITPFTLDSFSPAVEFSTGSGSIHDWVQWSTSEIVSCRNRPLKVRNFRSNSRLGSLNVTVAFGLAEHQPFLDPAFIPSLRLTEFSHHH